MESGTHKSSHNYETDASIHRWKVFLASLIDCSPDRGAIGAAEKRPWIARGDTTATVSKEERITGNLAPSLAPPAPHETHFPIPGRQTLWDGIRRQAGSA